MRTLRTPGAGDDITGHALRGLWAAVRELQDCAITSVESPLARNGRTLSFAMPDLIRVRNDSGDVRDITDVLGIDGSVTDPTADDAAKARFEQSVIFKGVAPKRPDHKGLYVICAERIADGAVGLAWAGGVCPAFVVMNDPKDKFADIQDGDTTELSSGTTGSAQILWSAGTDSQQWCIVRIGNKAANVFPVKLAQDGGGEGDASADPPTPTNWTYTVTDFTTGKQLATTVDPTSDPSSGQDGQGGFWKRPDVGPYKDANFGLAFYDDSDNLILTWINEVPDTAACQADDTGGGSS